MPTPALAPTPTHTLGATAPVVPTVAIVSSTVISAAAPAAIPAGTPLSPEPDPIADILAGLSTADKVGQLMIAGFGRGRLNDAKMAIDELRVGGIHIIDNVDSARSASDLANSLQKEASDRGRQPLLIAVNHEPGQSLTRSWAGITQFPLNWVLGSVQPIGEAIKQACSQGRTQGQELRKLGVHMNFAPVLDLVPSTDYPIGTRSYGADPQVAAQLGAAYIEAMQSEGLLAVGKHFPGLGSAKEDTHDTLATASRYLEEMEGHELIPFRAAIEANVAAIMTAHIANPLLDDHRERPASISPKVIQTLLRHRLGYTGIVMTDDIGEMGGVKGAGEPGALAVAAFNAGAEMIIVVGPPNRQKRMIEALIQAANDGSISEERLDNAVRRILLAKQQVGLLEPAKPIAAPLSPRCV